MDDFYRIIGSAVAGAPSLQPQGISGFPSTASYTMAQTPVSLPATTDQGLTVTYTVASGPATISGDTLTLTGAGTVVVNATQAGNGTYLPYSGSETITVTTVTQTLNTGFPSTLSLTMGQTPYTLPTSTDQGLTLSYSVTSGPATVSGHTLTLTGAGTVVLQATQAGNTTYSSFSATETITVTQLAQTLNSGFPSTSSHLTTDSPVTLPATTDQGLTITYAVTSGPATVSGNTLTLTGAGTVVVTASQAGNATYSAFPGATQTITVTTPAFVPTSISGLKLWLDGQDNANITQSSNKVSSWTDKSGTGNTVTQGTSANQPVVTANAINTYQALSFNGSSQCLSKTSSSLGMNSGFTMFAVWQSASFGNFTHLYTLATPAGGSPSASNCSFVSQDNTHMWNLVGGTYGAQLSPSTGTNYISCAVVSGTSLTSYLNGTAVETGSTVSTPSSTGDLWIGAKYGGVYLWDGYIGEILIYSGALNGTQINQVKTYLASKWGITVS